DHGAGAEHERKRQARDQQAGPAGRRRRSRGERRVEDPELLALLPLLHALGEERVVVLPRQGLVQLLGALVVPGGVEVLLLPLGSVVEARLVVADALLQPRLVLLGEPELGLHRAQGVLQARHLGGGRARDRLGLRLGRSHVLLQPLDLILDADDVRPEIGVLDPQRDELLLQPGEPDEVRLARLQQELVTLRIKYTDLWPDIIRIKDEIERLQKDMAAPKPKPKPVAGPPTPEVARLQDALGSVETELRLAKQDQTRLKQGISNYQARLDNAPKREQEYLDATRDYQGTRELYQTLSRKHEDALLAESMEQRQKGEQFRILDAALPSSTPAAPRRSRLLMASLALSFVLGAGSMVLMELLDTSFHSSRDLRAYTTVPILVNIPRIVTEADARRSRWRFRLAAVGVLVALIVVGGSSYFFAHGNEQLAQLLSRGDRAS